MKFTDSVLTMVGDFAAMKRTPDYNPSPITTGEPEKPPSQSPKPPTVRRHSLYISVGTEEIPKIGRQRSESVSSPPPVLDAKLYNKASRRMSAPCVSNAAASATLRKKLQKLREEKSCETDDDTLKEEEDEEQVSSDQCQRRVSVYRL